MYGLGYILTKYFVPLNNDPEFLFLFIMEKILRVVKLWGPCVILLVEVFFLREKFQTLYSPSAVFPFLPKAYGGVIIVNLVLTSILMLVLGFKVGKARSYFLEKAKKNGEDKDAEARYSLPKLYAGTYALLI